jgi:hypothetical protein
MIWALLSQEPLLAFITLSVARQLLYARLLVELQLGREIPFDEIGLLLPRESRGTAVDTFCAFVKRFADSQFCRPIPGRRAGDRAAHAEPLVGFS